MFWLDVTTITDSICAKCLPAIDLANISGTTGQKVLKRSYARTESNGSSLLFYANQSFLYFR